MDNIFSVNTIIIIFIILFPGIIIRRSFYSNKFSKQFYRGQFSERVITTLFWGIINIIVAFVLCSFVLKVFFNVNCIICKLQEIIYKIVTYDITKEFLIFNTISYFNIFLIISLFIFNLFILPFLIGRIAFNTIRKLKLDLKYSAFSFSNHWHYFFKGEIVHKIDGNIIDKKNIEFRTNQPNLTILDILTLEGDKKYLYKGILLEYNLKEGNEDLDSIILYQPVKKNYDKDKDEDGKMCSISFEKIPGNFLLIPYSNIVNLNVTIKPFIDKTNEDVKIEKIDNSDSSKKEKEESKSGCIMGLIYLGLLITSFMFARDISYFRYTIGLFFILITLAIISLFIDSLVKKFKFKLLLWLLVLLTVFYMTYIWIFNIDFFNPINIAFDFIKTVNYRDFMFWKNIHPTKK